MIVGDWEEDADGCGWRRLLTLVTPGGDVREGSFSVRFAGELDNDVLYTFVSAEGPDGSYDVGCRRGGGDEPPPSCG